MITQITTPFSILQDEWVMLAPLGDHPHALGIQRFTPAFIQNMASRFNGFFARMGRLFSGAPTFEGHHDIEPDKYPNSRSYGWIMSLEARADGLWGRMTWTPEGREMLQNGAFKFVSPVFIGKPIAQENGKTIFEPIAFKSLALTNEPNLPLPPLANTKAASGACSALTNTSFRESERQDGGTESRRAWEAHPNLPLPPLANQKDNMQTITELLELPNEASADQILEAVTRLKDEASARQTELTTLQNSLSTQHSQLSTDLANAIARADTAQTRLIGMILDNAIRENRITLAQRDHWQAELQKDLAAAEAQLANQQPALNTTSQTRELGNHKNAYDTEATRRAALTAYIGEEMANGRSYDEAWAKAKIERAEIFANMRAN